MHDKTYEECIKDRQTWNKLGNGDGALAFGL